MSDKNNVVPLRRTTLPSPVKDALADAFRVADTFSLELKSLLEKYRFKASFIEAVTPDLFDAFLNEDALPLWHHKDYVPPLPES